LQEEIRLRGGAKASPLFFSAGFGLMELIIVIVLVAILGAVATVAYKPTEIKARYQAERMRTDLRHAQMLALTRSQALRLTVAAGVGGSYTVNTIGGIGTGPCTTSALTDPATNNPFTVTVDPALNVSGTASVDLDMLGRPASCSGNPCSCAVLVAADPVATYSIAGGVATYTVDLRRVSGYSSITP
jgi:prepilin-type N-terminal cleavage/methylation domain-containing protein